MPIIRVEICGLEPADLPDGLAEEIRDAFVETFTADKKLVDVRVAAVAPATFSGHYELGDEPVYTDVLMYALPAIDKRRIMIRDFSEKLATIIARDVSTIVMQLRAAPKDRMAFGGVLLTDMKKKK